jgi:hypothetical protein
MGKIYCTKLQDCIKSNESCILGECGIPGKMQRCIPDVVPCRDDCYCDPYSFRCKEKDPDGKPSKHLTKSILDCKPTQYYEVLTNGGQCIERIAPEKPCSLEKFQCEEGYGCSQSELKCQPLCIVGSEEFGCPFGKVCKPVYTDEGEDAKKSVLGVCEKPRKKALSMPDLKTKGLGLEEIEISPRGEQQDSSVSAKDNSNNRVPSSTTNSSGGGGGFPNNRTKLFIGGGIFFFFIFVLVLVIARRRKTAATTYVYSTNAPPTTPPAYAYPPTNPSSSQTYYAPLYRT